MTLFRRGFNLAFVMKLRKHRTEMTPAEMAFAEAAVRAIQNADTSAQHLLDEMKKDRITLDDVRNTLKWGSVIEVNSYGRCLVRLMQGRRAGTCVVVDVTKRALVTAWYNRPSDNHSTIRMSEYGWKVDVIQYLQSLGVTA